MGSLWTSQVRGYALGEPVPEGLGTGETGDEWWRAGGGGSGEMPLMALEVLKPLLQQDLDRLSDKVWWRSCTLSSHSFFGGEILWGLFLFSFPPVHCVFQGIFHFARS